MHAPAIESYRTNWLTQSKNLGDSGGWQKAMASAGGRPDLGIIPKWDIVALYDGSAHMHDIVQGMSELAGSWRFYTREGSQTRSIINSISGLGRVVSKLSRPRMFGSLSTDVTDGVTID